MNIDLIYRSLPLLLQGAILTLKVLLFSGFLSLVLGTLMGVLLSKRLQLSIAPILSFWTFVLRAVPFYIQLLIVYFVLPDLLGINLDPFIASIVALGVCSSGYVAQVIRSGINAVPSSQWESATTLGYSTLKSLRYIILPQVFLRVLPVLTSELDALLKSSSVLSTIGLLELTRMGVNIVSREMDPISVYGTVAVFYIILSGGLNAVSWYLEGRLSYARD